MFSFTHDKRNMNKTKTYLRYYFHLSDGQNSKSMSIYFVDEVPGSSQFHAVLMGIENVRMPMEKNLAISRQTVYAFMYII